MPITTNDAIEKFGTQDEVTTTSSPGPGTIADGGFSQFDDIVQWTNDDDAPFAAALLKCQFDTTMPTAGSIPLFARPMNVEGTNDVAQPDANFENYLVGVFPIDFGVSNDVNFYTAIPFLKLPNMGPSQVFEFYIKNEGTGQTIGVDWQLWVRPLADGPHA